MPELKVYVRLLSDWTHGAGHRGEGADVATQRDQAGRVLLRGTHLTGLLREAVGEVLDALTVNAPAAAPIWQAWRQVLCGTATQQGLLVMRTATAATADAVTSVLRPGIRIDPITGTAADDHLRHIERAGATELISRVVLRDRDSLDRDWVWQPVALEAAWLITETALGLVEYVGGNRRRGAGQTHLELQRDRPGRPLGRRLADLAKKPVPPPVPRPRQTPRLIASAEPLSYIVAHVAVVPHQPLTLNAGVRSNVLLSHPYLTGTAVLKWLHWRMRDLAATDEIVRDAVVSGALLAGNGYPTVDGEQCWPAPLTPAATDPYHHWVRHTQPFTVHEPVTTALIPHNRIDPATGRTLTEAGFYAVMALTPHTTFLAEIRIAEQVAERLPPQWWLTLSGDADLGGKPGAAYGRCTMTVTLPDPAPPPPLTPDEGLLHVWLLSDLYLRGLGFAHATVDDLVSALAVQGVGVSTPADPDMWPMGTIRYRRIDSWTANAPRPTLTTLAAGSVVSIPWNGAGTEELAQIAATGLGERRAEGYGRLSLQHPLTRDATRAFRPPAAPVGAVR
ncbi:hypothetical protein [Granulicoccus sp. GXG6511]|uniref:hypothetical protein n=1 Tax=Granulicoccus sp. GXG6511 TaxID=3381351 RepID=UPI003D7DBADC